MKKVHKFYQDLYHQEFVFLPNWTEPEIYDVFGEPLKPGAGAVFVHSGVILIWIKEFTFENLDYLAHESVHAANVCFTLRGQALCVKNDEAQAYLVQWVFEKCIKHLKNKKK
jgi:hypothetical protein